jgi:hypothetical protein
MRLLRVTLFSVVAVVGLLGPARPADALSQGGTTFACTAACTATGTIVSTAPVTAVYPFFGFQCVDTSGYDYGSYEIHPTLVAPVVAGVYTYTWSATMRSTEECIGYASLTVFYASDDFILDTRYAPFDTRL